MSRGGVRPGSGRPAKGQETVSMRMDHEAHVLLLKRAKELKISIGDYVSMLVEEAE